MEIENEIKDVVEGLNRDNSRTAAPAGLPQPTTGLLGAGFRELRPATRPEKEVTTVESLLRELPASVRVGALDYRIVQVGWADRRTEDKYGQVDFIKQEIHLYSSHYSSVHKLADTVLHEIIRAIIHHVDPLLADHDDEFYVHNASVGLVSVFRDNTWLLPWLQRAMGR